MCLIHGIYHASYLYHLTVVDIDPTSPGIASTNVRSPSYSIQILNHASPFLSPEITSTPCSTLNGNDPAFSVITLLSQLSYR